MSENAVKVGEWNCLTSSIWTETVTQLPLTVVGGSNCALKTLLLFSFISSQMVFPPRKSYLCFSWAYCEDWYWPLSFLHIMAWQFFFRLLLLYCLFLKFTTCIIIIMHQKGSLSDFLQLLATCWWLLLLWWSAGSPEQRVCHFNCAMPGWLWPTYRYLLRERHSLQCQKTHWHTSHSAERCKVLECHVAHFPLFGRSHTIFLLGHWKWTHDPLSNWVNSPLSEYSSTFHQAYT